MKNFYPLAVIVSLLFRSVLLQAQTDSVTTTLPSFFDFLYTQNDSIPVLHVETNWPAFIRKKMEMEYQDAVLGFQHADGRDIRLNVKMKVRGNMRKQVCYYPPVRIKLPKKQLESLGFSSYNNIKMVLQCRSGSREEEWLMKECLIYHLYESISPVSLRTKLVRLQCTNQDKDMVSLHAFLLEFEDEMAVRLRAKVLNQGTMRISGLERSSYLKMVFFQYMIANTDWSVPNRHNLEFIMAPQYSGIVPIPYDFDYAGLIRTSYAVPYEELPILSVTDRYFQGYKVTLSEAMETARFYLSHKEEIMQRCEAFEFLDKKSAHLAIKFLSDFFTLLEDEKKVKRIFVTE